MRKTFISFAALLLFACKNQSQVQPGTTSLTEEDKQAITMGLGVKNVHTYMKYRSDSMLARTRMEVQDIPEVQIKSKMDSFYATWNKDIYTDTSVTMEEYLKYCKERNANPKEEYQFIDVYSPGSPANQ